MPKPRIFVIFGQNWVADAPGEARVPRFIPRKIPIMAVLRRECVVMLWINFGPRWRGLCHTCSTKVAPTGFRHIFGTWGDGLLRWVETGGQEGVTCLSTVLATAF